MTYLPQLSHMTTLTAESLGKEIWFCSERKKNGLENKWATFATNEKQTIVDFKAMNRKIEVKRPEGLFWNLCAWYIAISKDNTMNKFKIKIYPLKNDSRSLSIKYIILYYIFLQIKTFYKNLPINKWINIIKTNNIPEDI